MVRAQSLANNMKIKKHNGSLLIVTGCYERLMIWCEAFSINENITCIAGCTDLSQGLVYINDNQPDWVVIDRYVLPVSGECRTEIDNLIPENCRCIFVCDSTDHQHDIVSDTLPPWPCVSLSTPQNLVDQVQKYMAET